MAESFSPIPRGRPEKPFPLQIPWSPVTSDLKTHKAITWSRSSDQRSVFVRLLRPPWIPASWRKGIPGPPCDGYLGGGKGQAPKSPSQVWPLSSSLPQYFSDDSLDSLGLSAPHTQAGEWDLRFPGSSVCRAPRGGGGRWALPSCSHSRLPIKQGMTHFSCRSRR